jgi:hypothetical protein
MHNAVVSVGVVVFTGWRRSGLGSPVRSCTVRHTGGVGAMTVQGWCLRRALRPTTKRFAS